MAGKGFVELDEPVEEFPSDNGFGIERYPPHFAERREVGCLFGMGRHLASVGRRPRRVGRKNRLAGTENMAFQYLSRHGDHVVLWAIYERGTAESPPEVTAREEPSAISPDDVALVEAMRMPAGTRRSSVPDPPAHAQRVSTRNRRVPRVDDHPRRPAVSAVRSIVNRAFTPKVLARIEDTI